MFSSFSILCLQPFAFDLCPSMHVADENPRIYQPQAENAAQGGKGHFRMDTA